jgi:hypothetical protein
MDISLEQIKKNIDELENITNIKEIRKRKKEIKEQLNEVNKLLNSQPVETEIEQIEDYDKLYDQIKCLSIKISESSDLIEQNRMKLILNRQIDLYVEYLERQKLEINIDD